MIVHAPQSELGQIVDHSRFSSQIEALLESTRHNPRRPGINDFGMGVYVLGAQETVKELNQKMGDSVAHQEGTLYLPDDAPAGYVPASLMHTLLASYPTTAMIADDTLVAWASGSKNHCWREGKLEHLALHLHDGWGLMYDTQDGFTIQNIDTYARSNILSDVRPIDVGYVAIPLVTD